MRRAFAAAVLAMTALVAHAQDTLPSAVEKHDALYRTALQALEAGRIEEAATMLQSIVTQEPRHVGAWLDLAISHCELGNAAEAERHFARLERQFTLPPGIAAAIAHYRASGCGKRVARQRSLWLLAAGRGYDDNVNQGASNPRFTIGSGSAQGDYLLDSDYLPKADAFSQVTASAVRPLSGSARSLIAQLYVRRYEREHAQDSASALGAVEQVWKAGAWTLRGTAAFGYVMLDGKLYQRQRQLQARVAPPLGLAPEMELLFYGNLNHVSYPSRPIYDGDTIELGIIGNYRLGRDLVQATLTGLREAGSQDKPGGNRKGWFGNLQWHDELTPRLSLESGLSWQHWRSNDVYSRGLIETRRLQRTTTVRAAVNWELRPRATVVLEWRGVFNHENISLFQYNSRALQLSLRLDNF